MAELSQEQKQKIVQGIGQWQAAKGLSNAKAAQILGISASQLSRIKKGETERVLSDDKFLAIAQKIGVSLQEEFEWKPVKTRTFQKIWAQLEACKTNSLSAILCDRADIGKTFTARHFARTHGEVAYVDCSQVKTKHAFIRKLAREFGLDQKGRLVDVRERLIYYLNNVAGQPLIVLDEAGDLEYNAFLEIKALWNATEYRVGWYMMGADGLQEKIDRALMRKKVGYAEIFSRFGTKYQKVVPEGDEYHRYMKEEIINVAMANGASEKEAREIYKRSNGSLRRVYIEIRKMRLLNRSDGHAMTPGRR